MSNEMKMEENINNSLSQDNLDIDTNKENQIPIDNNDDIMKKIEQQINFLNNKFDVTNVIISEEKTQNQINPNFSFTEKNKINQDNENTHTENLQNFKNEK